MRDDLFFCCCSFIFFDLFDFVMFLFLSRDRERESAAGADMFSFFVFFFFSTTNTGLLTLELVNCPTIRKLDASLLPELQSVRIQDCRNLKLVDVTTTATITPIVTTTTKNAIVLDECSRLATGNSPGSTGKGTGMTKRA